MRAARSVARWLHFGAAALFVTTVVVEFLAALTTVQVFLPNAGSGWVAGLHPLNALVLFMLGHVVMRRNRRGLALRP